MGWKFDVPDALEKQIQRMQNTDEIIPEMLEAASKVMAGLLKGTKFGKYVKTKKPKKNALGWYCVVHFKGKTSSGASAGLAASIYEHGRNDYNPQPARPHIRQAVESGGAEAAEAMQKVLEEWK